MIGLRVQVRGFPVQWLSLSDGISLVSAGAHYHRKLHGRSDKLYFQATGIDDRDDSLNWLSVESPRLRSSIDITVVDTLRFTTPRRKPRRPIDWRIHFARMKAHDLLRIATLENHLRLLEAGGSMTQTTREYGTPRVAFRVLLNGRELGRLGVADPGALTINVFAKQSTRSAAALDVHGGEQLGRSAWRWYDWPNVSRPLAVGDRVSVRVASPALLTPKRVRSVTPDPRSVSELTTELAFLRRRVRSKFYVHEAERMYDWARGRTPPRSYPRS